MNISIIGTGYVGLVTGALFADRGNNVVCVDNNPEIIAKLNSGKIHIFEPGLEKIVEENIKRETLTFTDSITDAVKNSEVIFLAVGTPSNEDGSFNLSYLEQATRDVGKSLKDSSGFKVIVGKSTVPQGTSQKIISILDSELKTNDKLEWAYVSNPETLAEGTAVKDFQKPDRVIIGTYSDKAFEIMEEMYHPFNITKDRIMRGSPADAELAKLFSNTALATRVAMINEFARIADITPGADMDIIRRMICEDSRIGYKFMFPSPGYGGSCFPKDIQGLVAKAKENGYSPLLLDKIHDSNEAHKNYLGERIINLLKDKEISKIAVWGMTFKPDTDDMRDAASVPIITRFLNEGIAVSAYDPKDVKARKIFEGKVNFTDNKYEAVKGVDALALLTEWKEFDSPDYGLLSRLMKGRYVFDLRNRLLPAVANKKGFNYFGIGRNYPLLK
ncbi:MAG: UDP-glucose/GDP-mannose dehydrogenase family protein [Nanoarchaeota archaeon]|nr:UDP-glucose/GDP-mannose dehydrogenase family protein [Nanoarchaeota archaeon]MBU1976815.1 UDP-glucose/GDP-mannose dehydrogenase family protein [Nanoarchaeota archaeon]